MGKKNANEYETVVTRLSGHLSIRDEYFGVVLLLTRK